MTGGAWERLVRTVKVCLRVVIKNYSKSKVDFSTCLCQVEEIINKRPITYGTGSEKEILLLTPWDILIINASENTIDGLGNNYSVSRSLFENNSIIRMF